MAGGFGDMGKMMRQVQKMQAQMARIQDEMAEKTVEVTAGGGAIKVVASGQQEIKAIKIEPEAVDPSDVEMLEDLVVAAVNEALRKAQEMVSQEMAKVTGGIKLPGMF
ncbi:MAG: YbaB/EbfC family nucleoid-associated protein [bacterium]